MSGMSSLDGTKNEGSNDLDRVRLALDSPYWIGTISLDRIAVDHKLSLSQYCIISSGKGK